MLLGFVLNIFTYIVINVLRLRVLSKLIKDKDILNPFIVLFLFQLPIEISKMIVGPALLIDDGLYDKYYNFALLMNNIALLAELLLLILAAWTAKKYKLVGATFSAAISPVKMKRAAVIFFMLYMVFFLLVSSHSYGVINWIKNPRMGYQYHRQGAGVFWTFAISCISISFTLCCLFLKRSAICSLYFPSLSCLLHYLGLKEL